MKFGIVSDTHSNLHALKAVLEHMNNIGVDSKVHCGDLVGYGPKPSETLSLVLEEFNYIVSGGHDLAVVDTESAWGLTPQARFAVDWTRNKLTKEEVAYLGHLESNHKAGDILFAHDSPASNLTHTTGVDDANLGFSNPVKDFRVAFIGQTHVPFIWYEDGYVKPRFTKEIGVSELEFSLPLEKRAIINVGSVGQPRDGDSRASYAIYDTESNIVTLYKIPYAVDRTMGLMQRSGFSNTACERLLYGR